MKAAGKIVLGLTLLTLGIFLLIGLVKLTPVFGFLLIYPYILERTLGLGMNPYLAQVFAIIVGLAICVGVFRLLSSAGTRRRIGIGILAGIWISHSLALFFLTKDSLVNPITGERKYCTYNYATGRVQKFDQPLFDEFGRQATPCTDEQIKRFELGRQFSDNENQEVTMDTVQKGFISPESGDPLFFHCRDVAGKVRFYVFPGHCPFGGMLQPVDAAVIGQALKARQEAERQAKEKKAAEEVQRMKVEEARLRLVAVRAETVAKEKAEKLRLAAIQAKDEAKEKAEKARLAAEADDRKKREEEAEKKRYMANLYFTGVNWVDDCVFEHCSTIRFFVKEMGGVGATLNRAKLDIWKLENCNEEPTLFRARTPVTFEWNLLMPIRLTAMDHCDPMNYCEHKIDLKQYNNYMRVYGCIWFDFTLFGVDDNGHELKYQIR